MKIKFMGNRRGIVDVAIVALVAVCGVIMWLCGPTVIKATSSMIHGNGGNQKKATHKVVEQYPMFYQNDKGEYVPTKTPYSRSEESYALDSQEPEDSLWTKFWHMGAMAVLIIVVLSYLGLWPIITLWWNKKIKPKLLAAQASLEAIQVEQEELTGDAQLIVMSVDEGLAQFDVASAAAKVSLDSAQQSITMVSTTVMDATARAAILENAQHNQAVAQAVLNAVTNLKKDFVTAMSRKQDTTTKLLVAKLKND
jgi:hypothetical protein